MMMVLLSSGSVPLIGMTHHPSFGKSLSVGSTLPLFWAKFRYLELLQWLYERQDDLQILIQPPTQPLQPLNVEPTYICLHQGCTNRVTNDQNGFCDMHAGERNKRYDRY